MLPPRLLLGVRVHVQPDGAMEGVVTVVAPIGDFLDLRPGLDLAPLAVVGGLTVLGPGRYRIVERDEVLLVDAFAAALRAAEAGAVVLVPHRESSGVRGSQVHTRNGRPRHKAPVSSSAITSTARAACRWRCAASKCATLGHSARGPIRTRPRGPAETCPARRARSQSSSRITRRPPLYPGGASAPRTSAATVRETVWFRASGPTRAGRSTSTGRSRP